MDNYFVLAFDLGSKFTKVVVASPDSSQPFGIKLIHYDQQDSRGIHRGSVSDPDGAVKVIRNLITGAMSRIAPRQTKKSKTPVAPPIVHVCANVNGLNFKLFQGRLQNKQIIGTVSKSLIDDIAKRSEWQAEEKMPDYLIQHVTPLGYSVDNEPDSLDVLGKEGTSISARYNCYCFKPRALDAIKSLFDNPFQPSLFFATTSAKAVVVSSTSERNAGVAVVDLGAETTGVAVYVKNEIKAEYSIPFGSDTITLDIMKGLQIDEFADAEYIKMKAGIDEDKAEVSFVFDLPSRKQCTLLMADVNFFIKSRLEEIAAYVSSLIQKQSNSIRSIVLTGGGAQLNSVCDVFSDVCGIPTRIAETHFDLDDDTCQRYAAAIGMASMFCREFKAPVHDDDPADPDNDAAQQSSLTSESLQDAASESDPLQSSSADSAHATSPASQPVMSAPQETPARKPSGATEDSKTPEQPGNVDNAAQNSNSKSSIFGRLARIIGNAVTDDFGK